MLDKAQLRQTYLNQRRALSPQHAETASRAITMRLRNLPAFTNAPAVLSYVSSKDNEVDTHDLIQALLTRPMPPSVYVPIANPHGQLTWSRLISFNELKPGRFGILEPPEECRRMAEPPPNAIALVPGIAFTPQGYRIGYGGGYFDRFLEHFTGTSIGLAFACQMLDAFPIGEYDRPVDIVVTESAVYPRNQNTPDDSRS